MELCFDYYQGKYLLRLRDNLFENKNKSARRSNGSRPTGVKKMWTSSKNYQTYDNNNLAADEQKLCGAIEADYSVLDERLPLFPMINVGGPNYNIYVFVCVYVKGKLVLNSLSFTTYNLRVMVNKPNV